MAILGDPQGSVLLNIRLQDSLRQGPSERLKTLGLALGFQHVPWDLANVNEWKIMFDPSISLPASIC